MRQKRSGEVSVPVTSCLGLPSVTPKMAVDWGDGAGWWNELCLAESVSSPASSLRKARRHPRSVSGLGLRSPVLECSRKAWHMGGRSGSKLEVTERRAEVFFFNPRTATRGTTWADQSRNRDTDSGGQIGPEVRRSCESLPWAGQPN
jgi:hypothetical protein